MSGRTWRGLWPAGGGDGARDHVPGGDPCGAADGLGPAGRENCFVGQEEIRRLIENEQGTLRQAETSDPVGARKEPRGVGQGANLPGGGQGACGN